MKFLHPLFLLACSLSVLLYFTACEDQGPAETAGEKIDQLYENTRENLEETGESIQEQAEDAGDEIEEGIEETGEKIEEAGENLQDH